MVKMEMAIILNVGKLADKGIISKMCCTAPFNDVVSYQ